MARAGANVPLVLSGPPRSGTTMVSALLDGHSRFNWLLDEGFIFEHVFTLGAEGRDILVAAAARLGLDALIEGLRDRSIMPPVHRPPSDFPSLRYAWDDDAFRLALEAVSRATDPAALFTALADAYRAGLGYGDKPWLVLKAADYGRSVRGALDTFSDARGVVIVREPVAALNSLKRYREKHGYKMLSWPTLAAALTDMNRLAAFAETAPADRLLVLRYEDVTADPRPEMERLCAWLDIPFEDALLSPTMMGQPFASNSSFVERAGTEAPPERRPRVLTDAEAAVVTEATAPFRATFGYGVASDTGRD